MIARLANVTQPNIDTLVANTPTNGYAMLGNEPNGQGENVNSWISAWETVATDSGVIAKGIKLVSPSMGPALPGDGPNGTAAWFATFMAGITHQPTAISIHGYGNNFTDITASVSGTLSVRNAYHTTYPSFPLWHTEFNLFDLNHIQTPTDTQVKQYMNSMAQWFDHDPVIARWSWWYGGPVSFSGASQFPNTSLYDDSGVARAIGVEYRDNCGHIPTFHPHGAANDNGDLALYALPSQQARRRRRGGRRRLAT